MTRNLGPGLDPIAMQALQAVAVARTPEPGAADRAWAQMQLRLVDGPPPIELAPEVVPVARTRWLAGAFVVAAVAAAIVLALQVGARPLVGTEDPAPAVAPYSTDRDADVLPETAPRTTARITDDAASTPSSQPAPSEPAAITTEPPTRVRATKPRKDAPTLAPVVTPVPEPKTTTLAAEMKLLAAANAAMRAGNAAKALAILDEHKRAFANGQLAPERDYQRALALCELGRKDSARKVADAFVDAHPKSPLRAKAEGVCRD